MEKIAQNLQSLPKVMRGPNPQTALVHIVRDKLIYLAVVSREVAPLLVLELLSRVHGILSKYCLSGN